MGLTLALVIWHNLATRNETINRTINTFVTQRTFDDLWWLCVLLKISK